MQINLGKLIGRGATSEVYECGSDKVVKLSLPVCSIDSVKWEFHKTLCAYENNLPVPRVYELIEYDNRYGFIMEQVHGKTLKNLIEEYIIKVVRENIPLNIFAEKIFDYLRLTARCLYDIHKFNINQMQSMDDRMKHDVEHNLFLTIEEKSRVIEKIEALPKGNAVCHGDPNPNNIIINDERFIFIDWVNSGIGNPMYDIAEYVLLSTPSSNSLPDDTHPLLIDFFDQYKDAIVPTFINEYGKISGLNVSNYEDWFIPLLVSKLNSNRTMEEKYVILDDIRRRLNLLI